jgi:hypothetical protein
MTKNKTAKAIKAILVDLAIRDTLPLDMNALDENVFLPALEETETHEYLDHPDGGFASEEVPVSKESYWSIRSVMASVESDAIESVQDGNFDESNPVCDKVVPQKLFDDMANSLSSAICLIRDQYYPDDELAISEFDSVINDCIRSLNNYNKITK